jgi:hypothetical protein
MQPKDFEVFEDRAPIREALPYVIGLVLLGALAWFVYGQIAAVRGVRVNEDSKSVVDVVPLPPPPPPPPPPPESKEKPPEPTEQPQPSPAEAPKTPQQQPQAAPVTIAAPAQAGTDSFGIAAGNGAGKRRHLPGYQLRRQARGRRRHGGGALSPLPQLRARGAGAR